jgi:hypothetical protein
LENLQENTALITQPLLKQVAEDSVPRATEFTNPTVIFTDDKAPVEQVIHGLILSFVTGQ